MRMIIALLMLALVCESGFAQTTKPAGEDFFPILPWELGKEKQKLLSEDGHGIDSLRECGFRTAAFVTEDQLPHCEQAGVRALVCLPDHKVDWRELSDDQIVARVEKLVGNSATNPAVLGYFLMDEPGVKFFPALGKA